MRAFLLGLDGLTLKVVEPYAKAGHLPNFKKIMEDGCYGILRSTVPSITGPAWVSMATSKNPGRHGIYEFRKKIGYGTEIMTKSTSPDAEPIWSILNRNDKKVIAVNIPFTYPPDKIDDVMISGFMTPDMESDFVYPKEEKENLFRLIPDYMIDIDETLFAHSRSRTKLITEITKITANRRRLMNHYLKTRQWDLFFIVFTGTDRMQHFLWEQVMAMEPECVEFYKLMDDVLGDVIDNLDDETVLLIGSDHGFTYVNKFFAINTFFNQKGLLHLKNGKQLNFSKKENLPKRMFEEAIGLAKMAGIKKLLPSSIVNHIKKAIPKPDITVDQIDWSRTKAFSLLYYGIIYLNIKDREPEGIVDRGQYDAICQEVTDLLMQVEDPETGNKVIKQVFRGDKLYTNADENGRPDLVIIVNEGYRVYVGLDKPVISENRMRRKKITADHERDGFFAAYGSVINNMRIDAEIYDIMPTILYLMGTAIPEDVDGKILTQAINKDFLDNNEIKYESARTTSLVVGTDINGKETEQIEKQLRDLGYLS